jgi:hypothetical protein
MSRYFESRYFDIYIAFFNLCERCDGITGFAMTDCGLQLAILSRYSF